MPRSGQNMRSSQGRRRSIGMAAALLAVSPWLMAVGCDDASLNQFRDASAASLEAGLKQVFDGLVEGAFAAFVLGDNANAGG